MVDKNTPDNLLIPEELHIKLKLNQDTTRMLFECLQKTDCSKNQLIAMGIAKLHEELCQEETDDHIETSSPE